MNVEQMRAFLVVAHEPSLRRAAARLHLSQPALGERISGLERALGVRLVDRDSTGTRLTAQGQRLLPLVEHAVAALDDVVALAGGAAAAGRTGVPVRIALLHDGLEDLTWPVVQAVRGWPSEPEVRLRAVSWGDAVEALVLEEVDAVLARGPFGDERLEVRTVAWAPVGAAVAARHALADSDAVTLEQVAAHSFTRPDTAIDAAFERFWSLEERYPGREHRAVRSRRTDVRDLMRACSSLGGVGLLPTRLAPVAAGTGAVFRPLGDDLRCPLQVLTLRGSRAGRAVAATAQGVAGRLVPLLPNLTDDG